MSQHDFNIANQTSAASRTDINSALTALATLSSGATAPSTTYANMLWYDTANDVLKIRNEADSNWIVVGYVNQTTSKLEVLDDTSLFRLLASKRVCLEIKPLQLGRQGQAQLNRWLVLLR